jgi:mono/diheme cytochrome c family protein
VPFIHPVIHLTRMRTAVLLAVMYVMLVAGCKEGARASKDGKVLYQTVCAQCHGIDGRAVASFKASLGVPDLADAAVQAKLTDAQIVETITKGSKSGKMPPWGGTFNPQQIDALAAYVRTLKH